MNRAFIYISSLMLTVGGAGTTLSAHEVYAMSHTELNEQSGGDIAAMYSESPEVVTIETLNKTDDYPRSYFGVHTGLDIGGSTPIPMGKLGSNAKINVAPGLMPQLGGSWLFQIDDRWNVGLEVTYKKVDLDINAWVPGQRYRDKDNEGLFVTFRGTTNIEMSYTMLEIPLYAGYTFGPLRNNTIFLGIYYAYIINHDFKIYPTKGVITSSTGTTSSITPDTPYTQDFDGDLKNWDLGITVGYDRKLLNRLNLGFRMSMGVTDVFLHGSNALDYGMYQIRGSIVLSYKLFKVNHKCW